MVSSRFSEKIASAERLNRPTRKAAEAEELDLLGAVGAGADVAQIFHLRAARASARGSASRRGG